MKIMVKKSSFYIVLFSILFITSLFSENNFSFSDEGAVFLIDAADVELKPDYKTITEIHQKIKITGEKGKKFAELKIPFDSQRQEVKIESAFTLTSGNRKLEVTPKDIKEVTPAELTEYTALYPGIKTKTVSFPGVEIGAVVEYRYKVFTNKPLIDRHFCDGFYFQSTEPFIHSVYRLKIPKDIKINYKQIGIEPAMEEKKDNYIIYKWEKNQVPAIETEPLMPPVYEFAPRVYVSTFNSWQETGNWYYELSKECADITEDIKNKTEELIKDKQLKNEKIAAVYNYVCSNIRYVGLEIGIHGYKPHNASEVFRVKYGDCKDKANLMRTMLKIAGIDSYIALVNTKGKITKDIAMPGQFNHAILAVEQEDTFIFLDPTSEVFRFPALPPSDQDKLCLIASQNPKLHKSPLMTPEENSMKRVINAVLKNNGDMEAQVVLYPQGIFEASIRSGFRYLKELERKRMLARDLNKLLPGTTLKTFELENIEDLSKKAKEKYSFQTESYGIKVNNKMIFSPGLIDLLQDTSLAAQEKRDYPIRLGYLFKKEELIKYKLPEDFIIEAIPSSTEIETSFGYYKCSIEKETENVFIYHRIFQMNKYEISCRQYEEFKNFYKKVSSRDKLPVILTIKTNLN
jgi:hypothetical protein